MPRRKPLSSTKTAFRPPPRSSVPLKPIRLPYDTPSSNLKTCEPPVLLTYVIPASRIP
ncbi:hypothetical protein BURPSS13_C0160 [Burkholderia pseudomallei S13]|nr:hypothetical protein BURPSS13_C0160 [Burkholderia pseudomallei S13]